MANISSEIAAIQAASRGSDVRQPMIDALNALNSYVLPAVTSSDSGKVLKVSPSGAWTVASMETIPSAAGVSF